MELPRCEGEYEALLLIANVTLWVSIGAAILITLLSVSERILAVVEKIRAMRKPPVEGAGGGDGAGGGASTLLDSLKGLVAALAAAPPWFAIFLAGILLLWSAGKFTPAECRKQREAVEHPASPNDAKAHTDETPATSNPKPKEHGAQ
jgi:CDP-diglyceride synthetase